MEVGDDLRLIGTIEDDDDAEADGIEEDSDEEVNLFVLLSVVGAARENISATGKMRMQIF